MPTKVFFCYAHEDEPLLDKLKTHLLPLKRQGLIDIFWHDRDISAGTKWEQEIDEHLETSQIILLLVSPDFMASDYCYSHEMLRAIERHELGEAIAIPVILRPTLWQETPLNKLQALPKDARPVKNWPDLDDAFLNVAEGIRDLLIQSHKTEEVWLQEPQEQSLPESMTRYVLNEDEEANTDREQIILNRWCPVLEKFGMSIIGIENVPTSTVRVEIDGMEWEIEPLVKSKEYRVPAVFYHRLMAALSAGVPFMWYLWGYEIIQRPVFKPINDILHAAPVEKVAASSGRFPYLDPIAIGIIPTAVNRGIWCNLGSWYHDLERDEIHIQ